MRRCPKAAVFFLSVGGIGGGAKARIISWIFSRQSNHLQHHAKKNDGNNTAFEKDCSPVQLSFGQINGF